MKNFKYKKCLITNRGEVLKRISSTLKKMDIKSVAIDDGSSFVRENVDILLNEKSDISTYLDKEKLIRLAKKNGIDMIHPGYGFLSEDFDFASSVTLNNLIWIGPNHDNISVLSNKLTSKKLAQQLGIPTIKSSSNFKPNKDLDIKEIKSLVKDFRYPLIIKSIFSGGGKGIRIVRKEEDLKSLVDQCARESERYFPNSCLIIEEYLEKGFSHIEIQVIRDRFGNSFVIGSRECSIQRRNQKILEEAPASISEKIFKKLKKYSLDMIESSSFESIGTVEFLVNKKTEEIYFMEVNTRLQVEHTVTEGIYDLDLVELQIKIAHNFNLKDDEYLFNKLKEIDKTNKINQHSIEVRVCSETPFSFLPCPGRKKIVPVFYENHIRWDSGVLLNQDIEFNGEFDSLLTKIIVTASNRKEVVNLFNQQLFPKVKIEGVSNWDLFKSIFKENDFINNEVTTQYLETHIKKLEELNKNTDINIDVNKDLSKDKDSKKDLSSKNINYTPSLEEITVFAFNTNQTFSPRCNTLSTNSFNSSTTSDNMVVDATVNNKTDNSSNLSSKNLNTKKINNTVLDKVSSNLNSVYPPVPGKILSLKVRKNDLVQKNDVVCTIESMKMEIEVVSNYSGKVEYLTDSSWVNTTDAIVTVSSCSN